MNNVKPIVKGIALILVGAVIAYVAWKAMNKGVESLPKVKALSDKIAG